jgi:hypothetical protein
VALLVLGALVGLYISITAKPSVSPPPTSQIAAILALSPGSAAVGLMLGVVGLLQGRHGKLLPILGITLNSLPFAVGICAIAALRGLY